MYWTLTSSPALASTPVPSSISSISSFFGGAPLGTVTFGFVFFFALELDSGELDSLDEESEPPPHPPTARETQARRIGARRFTAADPTQSSRADECRPQRLPDSEFQARRRNPPPPLPRSPGFTFSEPGLASGERSAAASAASIFSTTPPS